MYIKEKLKDGLPITDLENYFIVLDFDRTITSGNSSATWTILENSKTIPSGYIEERDKLYNKYRPIEIDEKIDYELRFQAVEEWFKRLIELLIKYQIKEELFEEIINDLSMMKPRVGIKEFLNFCYEKNIPLVIMSAGVENFIEAFLKKNDMLFDNICIIGNKIKFENGIASGLENQIVHSFNKNETLIPKNIKEKRKAILIGDQISDIKMVDENNHDILIKIGFLNEDTDKIKKEYAEYFDILCENSDNYNDLLNILFRK